jgi:hypothetical protein
MEETVNKPDQGSHNDKYADIIGTHEHDEGCSSKLELLSQHHKANRYPTVSAVKS